jgi:hypothetical protein
MNILQFAKQAGDVIESNMIIGDRHFGISFKNSEAEQKD